MTITAGPQGSWFGVCDQTALLPQPLPARDHGKDLKVFIVSLERDEAVVLKTRFDPERLNDDLLKDEDDDLGRRLDRKLNRREKIVLASPEDFPPAAALRLIDVWTRKSLASRFDIYYPLTLSSPRRGSSLGLGADLRL